MREIYLTKNKLALVDNEDYESLIKIKWQANFDGKNWYAVHSSKKFPLRMHRFILGAKKGEIIDHIDGNGLNNQKNNLRRSTMSQNNANRRAKKNGASKYLGVYSQTAMSGRYKYFVARLTKDKVRYFLGQFKTEEEAALAYNEAAKKHHGEFARLNVVL